MAILDLSGSEMENMNSDDRKEGSLCGGCVRVSVCILMGRVRRRVDER